MFGKKKEEETVKTEDTVKGEETVEETKPTEETAEKTESEETVEKETEEEKAPVENEEPTTVEETQQEGNGVRIDDLVTRDELAERFAAFESKYEAILKENGDLKDEIAKLRSKYEEGDFGGEQKQGMSDDNRAANETFESYSRKFMK